MQKAILLISGIVVVGAIAFLLQSRSVESTLPISESPAVVVRPPAERPAAATLPDTNKPSRDRTPKAAPAPTMPSQPVPRTVSPPARPAEPERPAPEPSLDAAQEGAAALRRASAAYSTIRSMQADFTQSVENPLLGRRTTSNGTVYQRRPDRFLMKFTRPAGDVIVSDGEYFWIYYPSADVRQVIKTKAGATGALDLQAQFIGDPTKRFTHTTHGTEEVGGRPALAVTLTPREDAGYQTLKVWIDQQDNLVRRFELTNENGVVQHFDLSNLQINPTLSDALFRFTPPPNARIIER